MQHHTPRSMTSSGSRVAPARNRFLRMDKDSLLLPPRPTSQTTTVLGLMYRKAMLKGRSRALPSHATRWETHGNSCRASGKLPPAHPGTDCTRLRTRGPRDAPRRAACPLSTPITGPRRRFSSQLLSEMHEAGQRDAVRHGPLPTSTGAGRRLRRL